MKWGYAAAFVGVAAMSVWLGKPYLVGSAPVQNATFEPGTTNGSLTAGNSVTQGLKAPGSSPLDTSVVAQNGTSTEPVQDTQAAELSLASGQNLEALPSHPQSQASTQHCPEDMVRVAGNYCTEVRHTCLKWLDDPKLPYARCGKYEETARCVGKRVPMSFCMDRYEYTKAGEELPLNHQSLVSGSQICRQQGKRLCGENEWNFACEGEEMRPYPYGWERKPVCNQDKEDLYEMKKGKQVLKDLRNPPEANPECVSPFGVHQMAGNLDEPTLRENSAQNYPFRTALKGGWWMAARNRCRPATTAHDDHYSDIQVGVRCCADTSEGNQEPKG